MHVSDRMLAVIAEEEGVVLKAYRCPAGVLTVGIGHTSRAGAPKVRAGMRIDRGRAFAILRDDLRRTFEPRVARALPGVAQNVFDGAASFDFNTGRIHNASWVARLRAGNRGKAEASFKSWNKGGGRVLKGLVRRRRREADIIFRNDYGGNPRIKSEDQSALGSRRAGAAEPEEVIAYQTALAKLGYYRGEIDGLAGPMTIAAVEAFQKRHGLIVDGIFGPATRATLDRAFQGRTATKAGAAGGAAAGGADAALDTGSSSGATDATPWQSLIHTVGPVVTLVVVAVAIWIGFWIWRNRGRLFVWLPEAAKDFIQDRTGIVVGRRVSA